LKKSIRQIIQFVLFLAAGLLLLYFAFRGINFSEMKQHLLSAKYSWIGLSLILAVFAHLSRARRWSLLVEPLSHRPGFLNTFTSLMFGYLANYAFPRIGEVTRCVALGKKENIPVESLIGTVIVERAIDFISMLIILVILLFARFEKFWTFFKEYIFIPIGEKLEGLVVNSWYVWAVLIFLLFAFVVVIYLYRKKLASNQIAQKITGLYHGTVTGLKSVFTMKRKWEFLFHTLIIWTSYAFMTWVIVFAMPDITGNLTFGDGIFLLVIGSLGMAAPVQAGIGAFHWIVSRGLHFVYGLDLTEGIAFATLQHESQTLLVLLLGLLSLVYLFAGRKRREAKIQD